MVSSSAMSPKLENSSSASNAMFVTVKYLLYVQFIATIAMSVYYTIHLVAIYEPLVDYECLWYNRAATGLNGAILALGLVCAYRPFYRTLLVFVVTEITYHMVYFFRILVVLMPTTLGAIYISLNLSTLMTVAVYVYFMREQVLMVEQPSLYKIERTVSTSNVPVRGVTNVLRSSFDEAAV
ncbi:hypothetical protein HDE_00800 [Halotydeus destructor]|nr:hypothetical protein HDE_00800 [Halotydeus destructor]